MKLSSSNYCTAGVNEGISFLVNKFFFAVEPLIKRCAVNRFSSMVLEIASILFYQLILNERYVCKKNSHIDPQKKLHIHSQVFLAMLLIRPSQVNW